MKIAILFAALSMHVAGATSVGPPKAKKPDRRGVVLAGGHRVPPHARRTTAKTHSKGHQHPPSHSRRAAALTHHTKVTLDDPLRASTRGGASRIGVKQAPNTTSAPTSAPNPAPNPSPFAGTPTMDSEWFDIFSPTSAEDWECPPPQDFLDAIGMSADEFDCEGEGNLFFEDECAEMYNSTPPCPPVEVLALLNLTLAELACDSDVLPPCPYPELATQLGLDVDSLECDKEYWCFSHNHINVNSTKACPSDMALAELEFLYGVWCEYDDTDWFAGFGEDFNYTTLECPAPVPCSLPWGGEGATGIVACAGAFADFSGFTMCIDPTEAFEGDTCGCCGGTCPEPCTGTSCKVPDWFTSEETGGNTNAETGVWLVDTEGGYAQCVTSEQSALMQMDGYFTCMDACSTP